ncbi:TIGR04083 family peptide-modifying radical SAM enzyme [Methanothrix sp.]|uniref:TIGR04083 family peptide-modifying radical SAM enzyme n=1 Tax=Methanothrix sp. TaxID=90426 RepID=UPI003296EE65
MKNVRKQKRPFHVMIIPTLGCPSKCSYCWSSEVGSPRMTIETVEEIVEWLRDFRDDPVTFTFHGGEPLLAGADYYRAALPMLKRELEHLSPNFALQTNLWLLTPELAEVLAEHEIPIGSSLDGPQELNDLQRSRGYYERTIAGYDLAKKFGLQVQFICTFTSYSVQFKEEIFNFFLENDLVLKLHPALPSLRSNEPDRWALPPEEYGELLVYLLDKYLENMDRIEVRNINDYARCVFTGRGTVCTFVDCMENTFAVGPDGSIYPCYRFVGMPEFVMGNVRDRPSQADLAASPAGMRMHQFKEYVDVNCKGCKHLRYCRGGCPYNAIAPTDGVIMGVDPHCIAYKRIFDEISDRFNKEMMGSMGLEATGPGSGRGSRPRIMSLMQRMIGR